MVATALRHVTQRLPNDPSPMLLRRAHSLLDANNTYGCAIVLREALRSHLLALAEYHGVPLKRPKHRNNGELVKALFKAGKLSGLWQDKLGDCFKVCNAICHNMEPDRQIKVVLEMSYWLIDDECPWRSHNLRGFDK